MLLGPGRNNDNNDNDNKHNDSNYTSTAIDSIIRIIF